MHRIRLLSRIRDIALPCALLIALQACGSSATSVTSPTSITRCGITMQPVDGPLPADGGSAVISVAAARECAWSATVEGAWLTLKSGANGQGDGTVEFAATANPDPVMRRGAIVANGQRADISQAAGECSLSLAASSASISQAGGSGQIQVRASSGMCSWTAAVDVEWVQLRNTSGQGNAVVTFEVPASTGPPAQRHDHCRRPEVQHHPVGGLRLHDYPAVLRRGRCGRRRQRCHCHDAGMPLDGSEQRAVADAHTRGRQRAGIGYRHRRGDIGQGAHRHGGHRRSVLLGRAIAGL